MSKNVQKYDPYSDVSFGSMAAFVIKEVLKGKDIFRIPLPSLILEHRSALERSSSLFSCANCIISQNTEELISPLVVLKTYLAGWLENFGIIRKPINPLLGEIFLGFQNYECGTKSEVVFEQVSHHPPISAFYWESKQKGVIITGQTESKGSANGQSFFVDFNGFIKYKFLHTDQEFVFSFPTLAGRNIILGKKFTELIKTVEIKSGLVGNLTFKPKSFWSNERDEVYGRVKEVESTVVKSVEEYVVFGKFTKIVYAVPVTVLKNILDKEPTERNFRKKFANTNKFIKFTEIKENEYLQKFILYKADKIVKEKTSVETGEEEEMNEWETKKIWKELSSCIVNSDLKTADKVKLNIEELQRKRNKKYENKEVEYKPLLFEKDENGNYNFIWKLTREKCKNYNDADANESLSKRVRDLMSKEIKSSPLHDEVGGKG